MIQTESKVINGSTYTVSQLGASQGRKLLVRLVRVLGPVLGSLLGTMERGKATTIDLGTIDGERVNAALEALAARITEEDLDHVVEVLGAQTRVQTSEGATFVLDKSHQELHFAGRYGEMFQWIGFALRVNFSDFLGGVGSLAGSSGGPPEKVTSG